MTLKKRRAAKPERFAKTRSYVGFDLASSPARTVRYELDQGGHVASWYEIPFLGPIASGKTRQQFREVYRKMRGPEIRIPFWQRLRLRFWFWRKRVRLGLRIKIVEWRKGRRLCAWERDLVENILLKRKADRGDPVAFLSVIVNSRNIRMMRNLDRLFRYP